MEDDRTQDNGGSGLIWKLIAAGAASTTVIAVFVNVIISFSDMRSTMRDLQGKIQVMEDRISSSQVTDSHLEAKLRDIDNGGSRELLATKTTVVQLQEELKILNNAVSNLNEALLAHNNEMIELYKKGKQPPHNH